MASVLLFLIFILWGAGMTPLSIRLARRYGLLDYPNQRKIHHDPVPRGAGLVLWAGFMLWALLFADVSYELKIIVSGATLVFFAGYLDDMLSMSPFGRLAVHFAAAALALLLIGRQDALRMGLSAWTLPVVAMILGVFPWNFPQAKTFLGDGGVYMLGYLTAAISMLWLSPMEQGFFRLCATLLFVGGVPVMDTLVAITRRLLAGKSPFYPDRGHIHHRLLDRGFAPEKVLALLAALQCLSLMAAFFILKK